MKEGTITNEGCSRLLLWYSKNHRPLPWRSRAEEGRPNPYFVWLAEIMSQQTQIATLLPFYYRFTGRFPDVDVLAASDELEVLKYWTGLGYYSRARNLLKAARLISSAGNFPTTYEGWLSLPGIGPYSAAAICSQCFNLPEPVFDGNVLRVFSRLSARRDCWSIVFKKDVLSSLREKIRIFDPSSFNQSLMELGALVCSKKPQCEICPLQHECKAYKNSNVEKFPVPKPRPKTISVQPRVVIPVQSKGKIRRFLLVERKKPAWFAGMWDFPTELGGVRNPVQKNLALDLFKKLKKIGQVSHTVTHHKIELQVFSTATLPSSSEFSNLGNKVCWLSEEEILSEKSPVPLSTTARKAIRLYFKT